MTDENTIELLLSALRGEIGQSPAVRSERITSDEWRKMLALSRRLGVTPLLYRQLKMHGADDIPPEIMKGLQNGYLENAARNVQLYHQLSGILKRFYEDHIQVIPLKGAYLAERIYGNISVRPMGDVDILVRKKDLSRVEEILIGLGFMPEDGVRIICEENYNFSYGFLESGLRIEVHWDLLPPCEGIHVDINKIWMRSCPSMISGIAVRELAPDDLLLFLSVHAAKHVFDHGLKMVCDIAETLQYFENKIDWQRLQQTAQEWCAMRCLHVELWLADELFFAPIPGNVMNAIKLQNLEPSYQALLKERLFAVGETCETSKITPNMAHVWTTKNIPGKVEHLLGSLFPSRQFMALKYGVPPDSLRFILFYPIRLKDIMKRHARTIWRFVCRDARIVAASKRQSRVNKLKEWLFSG